MSVYAEPKRTKPWGSIYDPAAQPEPPQKDDMTHDEIRSAIRQLDDPLIFGALQRYHNDVLPRDRPVDPVKNAEGGAFNVADVVTGGAMGYFLRTYVTEVVIAIDKGRTPAQASGDAYDEAKKAYDKVVNPPAPVQPGVLSGPIGVSGRAFTVPE